MDPPADAPVGQEWYVVTGGGASALRISSGLTVGETETGALALDDPASKHQWLEFVLSENGDPWIAIVTRDKSLRVDGATHMRHQLPVGAAVQLPGNTLYISHDIRMPSPAGVVLEVVPRDVPGRPQDLVGPGWEEALAAVRDRSPMARQDGVSEGQPSQPEPPGSESASPAGPARRPEPQQDPDRTEVLEPRERPSPGARADATRTEPGEDIGITMAEPGPDRPYRRGPRQGRQAAVLLASVAVVTITLGGVAAVLFSLSDPERAGVDDLDPAYSVGGEPATVLPADQADPRFPPSESSDAASADVADAPVNPSPGSSVQRSDPAGGSPAVADPAPGSTALDGQTPKDPGPEPDRLAADVLRDEGAAGQGEAGGAMPSGPAPAPDDGFDTPGAETDVALIPGAGRARDDTTDSSQPSVPDSGVPNASAAEPAEASAGPPDWRLVRARELMDAGYITYPPQDNAVAYIERLLAVDPGNPRALTMLDECTTRLIDAAVRARDQGMDYEARNTLEEVLGFNPNNERANRLWREWVGFSR